MSMPIGEPWAPFSLRMEVGSLVGWLVFCCSGYHLFVIECLGSCYEWNIMSGFWPFRCVKTYWDPSKSRHFVLMAAKIFLTWTKYLNNLIPERQSSHHTGLGGVGGGVSGCHQGSASQMSSSSHPHSQFRPIKPWRDKNPGERCQWRHHHPFSFMACLPLCFLCLIRHRAVLILLLSILSHMSSFFLASTLI